MDRNQRRQLLVVAQEVKHVTGLVASGVNRTNDNDRAYIEGRRALLDTQELAPLLPQFLRECHTLADFWGFIYTKFPSALFPAPRRDWVRQQFLPVLDALENDRVPTTQPTQEQQFFAPGKQHDGFVAIRELVSAAKKSLFVADNFVDKTLWPLLTNLPTGALIRVLTKQGSMPADFMTEAQKFTKQYGIAVEVRTTDDLHDRFLVSDDQRCWHLGASVKDFGGRAALISEVTSQNIALAVRKVLEALWQAGKPS